LLDYTTLEPDSTITDAETGLRSGGFIVEAPLNGTVLEKPTTIQVPYLTPSKPARQSNSGTFFDSSFATIGDDDDGYSVGRSRKRTKFARHSGDWNLVDDEEDVVPDTNAPRSAEANSNITDIGGAAGQSAEPSSSVAQQLVSNQRNKLDSSPSAVGDFHALRLDGNVELQSTPRTLPASSDLQHKLFEDLAVDSTPSNHVEQKFSVISTIASHTNVLPEDATLMGPPSTPFKQPRLPQNPNIMLPRTDEGDGDRATTPRILPLASPGLPLVSPLIQRSGVEVGYFPIFQEELSQLDASGQGKTDDPAIESIVEISDNESRASDVSLVIVEDHVSESKELEGRNKNDSASDTQLGPSYSEPFQTDDNRDTDQIESSLLPDEWLSTLEASIAQELSNNDQLSPLNVQSERTVFTTESYSHPLSGVRTERVHKIQSTGIPGAETDDLYGDHQTGIPDPQPLIQQLARGDLHGPSQVSESEIYASAIFEPNQMTDISPIDVVEQSVHAHWATEALGLTVAATASDFITSPPQDQVESSPWIDSLDGNVESRERFQENAPDIAHQPETVFPSQRSETDIEGQLQDSSIPAEHTQPPAESDADATNQERGVKSPKHGQHTVPSVRLLVTQSSADVDYSQLPTPDQTQKENYSLDHSPEDIQTENQITLPSPEPSQEIYKIDLSETEPGKEPPLKAPIQIAQHTTPSEPEVAAPPRSSQRLSSRNAAISKTISSPFFTPRRSARFSTSPSREENIPLSSPHTNAFPSSPNQNPEDQERSADERQQQDSSSPVLPSAEPVVNRDSGLTTPLAYYPRLSSLKEHFGQLVDVIAVCPRPSTKVERAKAGPKDYHTSLHLVDPSCEPHGISHVLAQVFRPMKKALPAAQAGDIVLLHNFKVYSVKRNFALLSSDTSSWAVISSSTHSSEPIVVTSGPPLEQGSSEAEYTKSLYHWWRDNTALNKPDGIPEEGREVRESSDGPATRTRLRVKSSPIQPSKARPSSRSRRRRTMLDDPEFSDDQTVMSDDDQSHRPRLPRGSTTSPRQSNTPLPAARRRQANLTDNFSNEGDNGQAFEDTDKDPTPSPTTARSNRRRESTISTAPSTATQNQDRETTPRRSARLGRSPSVVHELRDGTKYVDEADGQASVVHELRDGLTYIDE